MSLVVKIVVIHGRPTCKENSQDVGVFEILSVLYKFIIYLFIYKLEVCCVSYPKSFLIGIGVLLVSVYLEQGRA